MNRIFISYRSSDGKKDADRLCADLSRLLGDEQVFFDKQDLEGGTSEPECHMAGVFARLRQPFSQPSASFTCS